MAERRFQYTQDFDRGSPLRVDIPAGEWSHTVNVAYEGDAWLVADPDVRPGQVQVTVIADPKDPVAMAVAENLQFGPDVVSLPEIAVQPRDSASQARFNPNSELLELPKTVFDQLVSVGSRASSHPDIGINIEVRVAPGTRVTGNLGNLRCHVGRGLAETMVNTRSYVTQDLTETDPWLPRTRLSLLADTRLGDEARGEDPVSPPEPDLPPRAHHYAGPTPPPSVSDLDQSSITTNPDGFQIPPGIVPGLAALEPTTVPPADSVVEDGPRLRTGPFALGTDGDVPSPTDPDGYAPDDTRPDIPVVTNVQPPLGEEGNAEQQSGEYLERDLIFPEYDYYQTFGTPPQAPPGSVPVYGEGADEWPPELSTGSQPTGGPIPPSFGQGSPGAVEPGLQPEPWPPFRPPAHERRPVPPDQLLVSRPVDDGDTKSPPGPRGDRGSRGRKFRLRGRVRAAAIAVVIAATALLSSIGLMDRVSDRHESGKRPGVSQSDPAPDRGRVSPPRRQANPPPDVAVSEVILHNVGSGDTIWETLDGLSGTILNKKGGQLTDAQLVTASKMVMAASDIPVGQGPNWDRAARNAQPGDRWTIPVTDIQNAVKKRPGR